MTEDVPGLPLELQHDLASLQIEPSASQEPDGYDVWRAERAARGRDLVLAGRRSWAAMEGWTTLRTPEQWEELQRQTAEDWDSGVALLEFLGGSRYIEPSRAALLQVLWRDFVSSYQPSGPAEYMVVAMALISFDHLLRVNTVVNTVATRLETELFSLPALDPDGGPHGSGGDGQLSEQLMDQLGHRALPALARLNRLVVHNLRALRDLKGAALQVRVENYGQVNLAATQTNSTTVPIPPPQASGVSAPQTCALPAWLNPDQPAPPELEPSSPQPRRRRLQSPRTARRRPA